MDRNPTRLRLALLVLAALVAAMLVNAANAADSPVADAASRGDVEAVRALLRAGADVNAAPGDGMSALHRAAMLGDTALMDVLLYAGADVGAGTRIGHYTPLHVAAREGNADAVMRLVRAGADVRQPTVNSGVLPLHLAAASGSVASVEALLGAGADPDARAGAWQQTPLMFAAAAGRTGVIRALLRAGSDPSLAAAVVDVVEMEKADKAAEQRLNEILAEFKAREGGGSDWRPTPSQVQAAIDAEREIQRRWPDVPGPAAGDDESRAPGAVTYNADGEPVDPFASAEADAGDEARAMSYGQLVGHWGGLTPLLHAVRQGHAEAVKALLEGGADIDQPSAGDGTTPLLMATVNGQFDLAMALIRRRADPNIGSEAGTTPLFAVLERNWAPKASYAHPVEHRQQSATHLDVLRALLDAGADPNVRLERHLWYTEYTFFVLSAGGLHYEGATPFWRAAQALDLDAMRLLRAYGADPDVPTVKRPKRRRPMSDDEEEAEDEPDVDHSGLPPVPIGGPYIYPIHAAAGAGYGQYFAANAHRHVPDNWLPTVEYLVEECGADVNLRDANGYTPLHHAASRGDVEMIRYLVGKGADVTAISRSGQTTADMANGPIERVPPYPDAIELLMSLGSKNNENCKSC